MSTAKFQKFWEFKQFSKILAYKKTKIGPMIETWGTPHVIGLGDDLWPSISHVCTLTISELNFSYHKISFSQIEQLRVWNAFDK